MAPRRAFLRSPRCSAGPPAVAGEYAAGEYAAAGEDVIGVPRRLARAYRRVPTLSPQASQLAMIRTWISLRHMFGEVLQTSA